MPAPRLYVGVSDMRQIMGCGAWTARAVMTMFKGQGKTCRMGKADRVDARIFADWLAGQDGSDAKVKRADIIAALKGAS